MKTKIQNFEKKKLEVRFFEKKEKRKKFFFTLFYSTHQTI